MFSAVNTSVNDNPLAGLEIVKQSHLVAGKFYKYIIRMNYAITVGPCVIKNKFPLLEWGASVF